ncbi:hypothetical protein KSP40_PGU015490 [Platanthera guangdongensis]|uniref:Maturase K n=1 Tax=Platanthera guangdongensis TaxID=2320717 RepID=A0ABR2LJV6_9ASPA
MLIEKRTCARRRSGQGNSTTLSELEHEKRISLLSFSCFSPIASEQFTSLEIVNRGLLPLSSPGRNFFRSRRNVQIRIFDAICELVAALWIHSLRRSGSRKGFGDLPALGFFHSPLEKSRKPIAESNIFKSKLHRSLVSSDLKPIETFPLQQVSSVADLFFISVSVPIFLLGCRSEGNYGNRPLELRYGRLWY